jgi:hypothetical protein
MILQDQGSESDRQRLRRVQAAALPIWQLQAMEAGCLRSCINCIQFDKKREECLLAPGQRPPALVIALGCDSWEMDIPF